MEPILAEAFRWRDEYGLIPIPLRYKSKTPALPWGDWLKRKELPADAVVRAMFRGQRGIAVIAKWPYLVVDFDSMDAYRAWKKPTTYETETARGVHVWLNAPDIEHDDLVVRGADLLRNRLVTLPPSTHVSGAKYRGNGVQVATVSEIEAIARERKPRVERKTGEKIVSSMSVEEVLGAYGIEMRAGRGRYAKALCPFHDDHEPSFLLDMKTGHVKCMSPSCKASTWWADAIDLYAMLRGVSLKQAIVELRCL